MFIQLKCVLNVVSTLNVNKIAPSRNNGYHLPTNFIEETFQWPKTMLFT